MSCPPPSYGGSEQVVSDLVRSLGDLEVEYTLFAPKGSKAPGGDHVETCTPAGKWVAGAEAESSTIVLSHLLDGEYDVVVDITHEGHLIGNTKTPIVKLFSGLSTWTSAVPPAPKKLVYVTISQYHRSVTMHKLGVDSTVLNHGIDTDLYCPPEKTPERKRFLALSMVASHKGQASLVRHMDHCADLDIAGECDFVFDKAYVNFLRDLCDVRGARFIGTVPLDEKVRLLQHAKAVVLPFLPPGEAWSLIATEALSCNTPVLTTDTGAMREIVAPGTGRVFADVAALAVGMRETGWNYSVCRDHALRSFGRLKNAMELMGIVQGLIG